MQTMTELSQPGLQEIAVAAALVATRLSGLFLFAPVLSSSAIPARVKAGLVGAVTLVIAPTAAVLPGAAREVTLGGVLGELSAGLALGLVLSFIAEAVVFASALLGMQFSFSLVNLIDPVSRVETPVLGQLLGWIVTLTVLGAGLHRELLAGILRSFWIVPVGHFAMRPDAGAAIAHMAAGIFLTGVQLASPVLAAALTVEVTVALISRMAPALPANVLSVPVKTLVSYVTLAGSLSLWPVLIEHRFEALLDKAGRLAGVA
jgi:flagellar biosynthesis protein FliR